MGQIELHVNIKLNIRIRQQYLKPFNCGQTSELWLICYLQTIHIKILIKEDLALQVYMSLNQIT